MEGAVAATARSPSEQGFITPPDKIRKSGFDNYSKEKGAMPKKLVKKEGRKLAKKQKKFEKQQRAAAVEATGSTETEQPPEAAPALSEPPTTQPAVAAPAPSVSPAPTATNPPEPRPTSPAACPTPKATACKASSNPSRGKVGRDKDTRHTWATKCCERKARFQFSIFSY